MTGIHRSTIRKYLKEEGVTPKEKSNYDSEKALAAIYKLRKSAGKPPVKSNNDGYQELGILDKARHDKLVEDTREKRLKNDITENLQIDIEVVANAWAKLLSATSSIISNIPAEISREVILPSSDLKKIENIAATASNSVASIDPDDLGIE